MVPPQPNASASPLSFWSDGGHARRYDRPGNRSFYQSALTALLDGAPGLAGRGLDLGCGTGFATELLVSRYPGVDWLGIDAAASMLAVARAKPGLARVGFAMATAESLPLAAHSLDVVVANFSWHWFGPAAAHEVRRVLRPGGWLLATVPLRAFSAAAGNHALARAVLAQRRTFQPRASQGLRFSATAALLPGSVRLAKHELRIARERFTDAAALLDALDSRGALRAIFGDGPIDLGKVPMGSAPVQLDYTWPFALVHLQVRG